MDNIGEWAEKQTYTIKEQMREEEDKFIWECVHPFCEEVIKREISKDDLKEAVEVWMAYREGHLVWKSMRNGIVWHDYPKEKPKNNGRYLCVFDDGLLDFAIYADGKWRVLLCEVEWWAELPDTPVCRRENAE